ncbi:uncharacterized protein [Pseudochaenichthys georgianus]|uniref:uncharacterized protein isoform X2 n=1 Tax=Pseudochaenichthys georgianus TaxID=52239 RepID=UPI00146D32F1|nr:uncharacterized protein LOC117450682 isoform X2 [Pseudochaenichthys georgianus]
MYQFAIVFTLFCIGKTLGKPDEPAPKMSQFILIKCLHRNISCNSTMAEGYTFPFSCPAEGDVNVYQNKSKIAASVDGPRPYDYSDEVKSMTSDSVTTRHCRDLHIQCFFTGENKCLTEICVDYKVTEEPEEPEKQDEQDEPDPTFPPNNLIVGLCVVVGLIVVIVVLLCWKKHPAGSGFQERIAGDLEGQQLNGDISGNTHAPVVIKDPNHRAMNGSERDDPGGINDNNGEHFVRIEEMHNGCAPGCGGPEACENEGHRLLPPESADRQALQPPDMTDEARALVNKAGFESNQPRMCSTAPENGVKSTTNMGNYQY